MQSYLPFLCSIKEVFSVFETAQPTQIRKLTQIVKLNETMDNVAAIDNVSLFSSSTTDFWELNVPRKTTTFKPIFIESHSMTGLEFVLGRFI